MRPKQGWELKVIKLDFLKIFYQELNVEINWKEFLYANVAIRK